MTNLINKIIFLFISAIILPATAFSTEKVITFRGNSNLNGIVEHKYLVKPSFKWRKQLDNIISSAIVSNGEVLIVNCTDGTSKCLKVTDGSVVWSFNTGSECEAAATIIGDNVLLCSTGNSIFCVSISSGSQVWQCQTGGKTTGSANYYQSSDKQYVLVGCYDSKAYCIDYKTGKIVWNYEAENYINGSFTISGNICAFGSCDGYLYFLNIDNGALQNKYDTGAYIPGWPVISDNVCYAGNYEGIFYAVDVSGAELKWKRQFADHTIMSGPAIDDKSIYFNDEDGSVFCLSQSDGSQNWVFNQNDSRINPPLVSSDSVFVTSEDTWLYILNKQDGSIRWKYLLGEEIDQQPCVYDNSMYFSDASGRIYCFSIGK